jgi:GntR family transcriptional regulator, transcriptional repressor for pyruvate dehydrogenase complex
LKYWSSYIILWYDERSKKGQLVLKMKKDDVLEKLIDYVGRQKLKKGDRLPAERQLVTILMASRTTVREAVRRLEERGVLTIKRGSGIYVNRNWESMVKGYPFKPQDTETLIKDQLEARFMLTPVVVSCAATRATEPEITELQDCIVKMSRAIVARELEALAEADTEFFQILAGMTKNHKLVKTMEQLSKGNEAFWSYFIKNDEFVNNVIFAGYVEIVNSIKRKDHERAGKMARRNIVNACEWLSNVINFDCSQIFGKTAGNEKKN